MIQLIEFSSKTVDRVSLLKKYSWNKTKHITLEEAFQVHFANQTSQTSLLLFPIWYLLHPKLCAAGTVARVCDTKKQRTILKYSFGQ